MGVAPCRGAVKMGVSIKCLFVLALCSQILPSQQACPDNCHVEDGRLVTVKCVDNGGTADCACQTSGDDSANTEADCASVTSETFDATVYADFDSAACKALCDNSEGDICAYWKFMDGSTVAYDPSKSCYLMDDTQCTDKTGECKPEHGCEVGCSGSGGETTGVTCPAQSVHTEADLANKHLYWRCYHVDDNIDEEIDIYNEATAPEGTACTLTPSCKKYQNAAGGDLQYVCKDVSGTGQWTSSDDTTTHDADVIDDTDKMLKEPTCNADPLTLKAEWKQDGMEINCVDGFAKWDGVSTDIPSENHCLMFCDYYHVLSFYSKGESGWYYQYTYDGADDSEQELQTAGGADNVEDVIKCWNS